MTTPAWRSGAFTRRSPPSASSVQLGSARGRPRPRPGRTRPRPVRRPAGGAASEMRSSSASSSQFAISEEPPADRNGVVWPVSGISPLTPPMITKTCRPRVKARPPASSLPNESRTVDRGPQPALDDEQVATSSAVRPNRPISSPMPAKMKSLCTSGTTYAVGRSARYGRPLPGPAPNSPPVPSPSSDWTSW